MKNDYNNKRNHFYQFLFFIVNIEKYKYINKYKIEKFKYEYI